MELAELIERACTTCGGGCCTDVMESSSVDEYFMVAEGLLADEGYKDSFIRRLEKEIEEIKPLTGGNDQYSGTLTKRLNALNILAELITSDDFGTEYLPRLLADLDAFGQMTNPKRSTKKDGYRYGTTCNFNLPDGCLATGSKPLICEGYLCYFSGIDNHPYTNAQDIAKQMEDSGFKIDDFMAHLAKPITPEMLAKMMSVNMARKKTTGRISLIDASIEGIHDHAKVIFNGQDFQEEIEAAAYEAAGQVRNTDYAAACGSEETDIMLIRSDIRTKKNYDALFSLAHSFLYPGRKPFLPIILLDHGDEEIFHESARFIYHKPELDHLAFYKMRP